MMTDLPTILSYQNIEVLNRYSKDYPNNKLAPQEAFEELMKFFWLFQKHQEDKLKFPDKKELDFICGIHTEMKEIDDMWHTFLLFTKDYISFCKQYLGRFFHHSPTTDKEKAERSTNDFEIDFVRFLSYAYDNLGEEIVRKWFGELLVN